jgi:hypothetical protein
MTVATGRPAARHTTGRLVRAPRPQVIDNWQAGLLLIVAFGLAVCALLGSAVTLTVAPAPRPADTTPTIRIDMAPQEGAR